MPVSPPVIDVYVTSILSSAQLRTKHDRVQRILVSARVPFSTHDVASSEGAKMEWKRRNRNNNELPCIIVDGQPVGTIEQLDEAVEFGELRQFLRLDEPTTSTQATTTETTPPPPPPSSEKPTSLKPTVDDFASLSLTESELAQLEQEISSNRTLSLPEADPPSLTSRSSHGFATQVHHVMPLNLHRSDKDAEGNRIEYRRVGDHQRPLRMDASQDLQVLDGVEDDELEKLARELEMEEEEQRAQLERSTSGAISQARAPSPPPKDEGPPPAQVEKETPPTPKEEIPNPSEPSTSSNLVPVDSVGGDGGAGLSKPLDQVQKLDLSPDQVDELLSTQDTKEKEIEILQPTEVEKSAIEATKLDTQPPSVPLEEESNRTAGEGESPVPKSSKDEVERLKKELKEGNGGVDKVVELELDVPKEVAAQGETARSDEVESST